MYGLDIFCNRAWAILRFPRPRGEPASAAHYAVSPVASLPQESSDGPRPCMRNQHNLYYRTQTGINMYFSRYSDELQ